MKMDLKQKIKMAKIAPELKENILTVFDILNIQENKETCESF